MSLEDVENEALARKDDIRFLLSIDIIVGEHFTVLPLRTNSQIEHATEDLFTVL